MRRRTLARDVIGTAVIFFVLCFGTFAFMLLEHFLDNFKSH
ncbi:MAG: hypothetical protein ABR541_06635 [Candidatus Dormibacteria bacterium]